MKITHKKIKTPLIKIHFLKNQYYKSKTKYFTKVDSLTLQLKQVLKIIYLYKKNKKKILFLGFPYNNVIQNQLTYFFISKTDYFKTSIDINLYDLIVFNKTSESDLMLLKELGKKNIPLIIFGGSTTKSYNVPIPVKKRINQNFNFFIIFTILLKSFK